MTKKSEFIKLMAGVPEDRVLFYPVLMHFAARFSGKTYGEFASDYHVLVESQIKCLNHFDLDMVSLISDPYRETSAFGAPVEFIAEGVPQCKKILVRNSDDVRLLKRPDVYKCYRTHDRIKGAAYFQKLLHGIVPVMGWVEGPLAEACDLAGVTEMLIMLMMDPGCAERLLDKCLLTAQDFAAAQIEAGCDLVGIGDAICSQIDQDSYDTFVLPRHRELVDFIHSRGAMVKMHICGNTTHLWPSLAQLNLDIFDLDHMADMEAAFGVFGPEVIRCGNINPVDIQDLTPDALKIATESLVRSEIGRKFMLSGGCEITVNTPPENLLSMRMARG